MTQIKVCGLTDADNAAGVAATGVEWIGLNFWPQSKRFVTLEQAREVAAAAREASPKVRIVGLFVNQSRQQIEGVLKAMTIDLVQLHGEESASFVDGIPAPCMKAFALASESDLAGMADYRCDYHLVDSLSPGRGGSGRIANWPLAALAASISRNGEGLFLAGGLGPGNVTEAIAAVRPFAVDVASGVESRPGIKDLDAVSRFVDAVRSASDKE